MGEAIKEEEIAEEVYKVTTTYRNRNTGERATVVSYLPINEYKDDYQYITRLRIVPMDCEIIGLRIQALAGFNLVDIEPLD